MKSPLLVECLKTRSLNWIEENTTNDWQYRVASDKKLLYPYPTFSAALLAFLQSLVRHPIAQMLFVLEELFVTKTFISISQQKNKNQFLISFLQTMFIDPNVLNIKDLPEPRHDQYMMPEHYYNLKFPFSYYFMKKINGFRVIWENELVKLEDPENCDDNQELLHDVFENTVKRLSDNIIASFPAINEQAFNDSLDLYLEDFVTVIIANDAYMKDPVLLERLLRQLIVKDKKLDPVLLHIFWWENSFQNI
ncbi:1236_t:CDS:1, partial [Scutellospora calospora]